MRIKMIMFLMIGMFLAGCAVQRIPFPESEYAGLNMKGDKTIKGTVFLVDQLDERQVGAGSEVTLEPITSYSEQWYEVGYQQKKILQDPDPRYHNYVMRTKADDEGSFSISGIAAGEYLLTAPLHWLAITCSANEVRTKVMISKKITVKEDDTVVEIPLTKDYESPVVVCDLYTQGDWEKEFGL